jgi:translation initiation factor IF-1
MSDENIIKVQGTVTEALPNATFRIDLDDGRKMIAYLSGKMRKFRIKVLIGDTVEIVTDKSGEKGRIVKRF